MRGVRSPTVNRYELRPTRRVGATVCDVIAAMQRLERCARKSVRVQILPYRPFNGKRNENFPMCFPFCNIEYEIQIF